MQRKHLSQLAFSPCATAEHSKEGVRTFTRMRGEGSLLMSSHT